MRLEHAGAARVTRLTAELSDTGLVIECADLTGWPTGAIGPFWATLNKGQLTEEKVLCASTSSTTIAVYTSPTGNGRGGDGTTAQTHPVNSTIEHVWTAQEADAANAHIESADGAHGYPPKDSLVTLTGDQHITGVKTMDSPVLETPTVNAPVTVGGTHTAATKMSVSGAQAEAEFRVRNVYIGVGDPSNSLGNDGDMYISKG
jgi:hypothetical protein